MLYVCLQTATIPTISDEDFFATPEHMRGLDRVVDPQAPSFMASRYTLSALLACAAAAAAAAAAAGAMSLVDVDWRPIYTAPLRYLVVHLSPSLDMDIATTTASVKCLVVCVPAVGWMHSLLSPPAIDGDSEAPPAAYIQHS